MSFKMKGKGNVVEVEQCVRYKFELSFILRAPVRRHSDVLSLAMKSGQVSLGILIKCQYNL
jgi:hypothetical protein